MSGKTCKIVLFWWWWGHWWHQLELHGGVVHSSTWPQVYSFIAEEELFAPLQLHSLFSTALFYLFSTGCWIYTVDWIIYCSLLKEPFKSFHTAIIWSKCNSRVFYNGHHMHSYSKISSTFTFCLWIFTLHQRTLILELSLFLLLLSVAALSLWLSHQDTLVFATVKFTATETSVSLLWFFLQEQLVTTMCIWSNKSVKTKQIVTQ